MFQALWHSIWADNSLPGRSIVLIIGCLLLWAVRAGSRHLRRYRKEGANLSLLMQKLRQATAPKPAPLGEGAEPKGAPGVGEPERLEARHVSPADLASLRKGLDPESLIAERLEAIEKLRTRQVKVSPNALQQLSLARDEARPGMAVPGAVGGLAIMLGLLGTFIGLAIMVQQVQFVLPESSGIITVNSWTRSVENISRVLGGIKTAFSCSLVGIVCAILASLLNFRLRTTQALFFETLERFTTEELLPAAVPAVEDESLLDRVSLQLENSFTRLEEIYRQNQDSLKDLTGAQLAFVDIVEEIRKITRSEASRNLEGVLDRVTQTNKLVLSVTEQLPRIVTAIETGQRRLTDRLASLFSSVAPMPGLTPPAKSRMTLTTALVVGLAILALTIFFFKS